MATAKAENNGPKAGFPAPLIVERAIDAVAKPSFRLDRKNAQAYFVRRSKTLFVTFDNLATVAEHDPPQPWLFLRTEELGVSVLGLIAKRKDWYRNEDAPKLLTELNSEGFFNSFDRIILTGASMGGYAALAFAHLVPEAKVLAFSPQTTLNREIAPFEERFRYGHRKWDWKTPAYLDAVEHIDTIPSIWVFFDPFVVEDKLHAERVLGSNVSHIKCDHFGHKLIRQLKASNALDYTLRGFAEGSFEKREFWKLLRGRRDVRSWRKTVLTTLEDRGHRKLATRLVRHLEKHDPGARYLKSAKERLSVPTSTQQIFDVAGDVAAPPFDGSVTVAPNAFVVPERPHDQKLASGVLLSDRSFCAHSRTWIRARKTTFPPKMTAADTIEDLPGRHLFAGHFRGHFGHFLVESTARLWALGAIDEAFDGIIYTPYRGNEKAARKSIQKLTPFFALLGIDIPVQTFGHIKRVEELVVPELGFGWNERYAGSPQYRRFMRQTLGSEVKPEGSDFLYVSRAKLPDNRGRVLGEALIEEVLAGFGYEIFHPEKHPLEVQIARYKAAKKIVALDGSALHLAAFFFRTGGEIAIIQRRSRANVSDYVLQYRSFCEADPTVIDVIKRDWVSGGVKRSDYQSIGELDFAALYQQLAGYGFIPKAAQPKIPSDQEILHLLADISEKRNAEFRPIG